MAWKASWAHRTGENEKRDTDKKKNRSERRAPVETTGHFDMPTEVTHIISFTHIDPLIKEALKAVEE